MIAEARQEPIVHQPEPDPTDLSLAGVRVWWSITTRPPSI